MLDVAIMSSSIHFDVPLCSICFLKAPLDHEDLEASSTSLPPDIASRRRGKHFKLQTSRKDILNLPVPQKQARGRGASGCTHLPSMEQQADIISTPFQMIKTLIDQIEDQQSLAMNRALNIMPWMVELIIFQRLIMSIQLGLCSGNPRRTFRNGLHARPMEYHELVAGTPRITREQAGPRENHSET